MPTYAYACTACGHRFEVQQSFSDASLTECPECQGKLRKLFNTVGIVFKGSGFYRTDSRASASSDASSSEGASKPAEGAPKPAAETSSGSSSSGGSKSSASGGSGESKSSAPAA